MLVKYVPVKFGINSMRRTIGLDSKWQAWYHMPIIPDLKKESEVGKSGVSS